MFMYVPQASVGNPDREPGRNKAKSTFGTRFQTEDANDNR
jgi:hypothetical protein